MTRARKRLYQKPLRAFEISDHEGFYAKIFTGRQRTTGTRRALVFSTGSISRSLQTADQHHETAAPQRAQSFGKRAAINNEHHGGIRRQ